MILGVPLARRWLALLGSGLAAALLFGVLAADRSGAGLSSTASHGAHPAKADVARAKSAYGKLPLRFEANRGQTDRKVNFTARGPGYTLFLTPREAVLSLGGGGGGRKKAIGSVLRMRLLGAQPHPRVAGLDPLPGTTNYLNGRDRSRWRSRVPGYGKVRYREVYPGVDVLYHGRQGHLEYDFTVAPGADPAKIALGFRGAARLALDRGGNLVARTRAGVVREPRPVLYQQIRGQRRAVSGAYVLHRGHRVGFRVGRYDRSRPLVIDPVLAYSTYLGGGGGERGAGIAVDASGNAYVAGFTSSADFPVSDASYQSTRTGDPKDIFDSDAFVTKLSPGGKLVYSTFLGGSDGLDSANAIAIDASGRAYVAGDTQSRFFPTTGGALQPTAPPSFGSAFFSVLKADGSGLVYSSYLGGRGPDGGESATGVAVDASRHAYVTGGTSSADFPTKAPGSAIPLRTSLGGPGDAFVAKLDPDAAGASSLVYSTYLGGGGREAGTGIAVDQAGGAYVTGRTDSTDFPTRNPLPGQGDAKGGQDAFVSKLNPTGSALDYSTYLAGANDDAANAIAADSTGHAYVTGSTNSTDFPTHNAFQSQGGKPSPDDFSGDAFVAELTPAGSAFAYSSYLGGKGDDVGTGIALDASGGAYVVGEADTVNSVSGPGSFPMVDPLARAAANGDAFIARVKPGGSGLSFSSYFGGGGEDEAYAVAVDSSGSAYLTGDAVSTDFPTRSPFQARSTSRGVGDRRDAFVTKVAPGDAGVPLVTGLGHSSGPAGTPLLITGHGFTGASAVRFGTAAASTFTVNSDEQITVSAPSGVSGPVAVTVTTPQGTSPPNPIANFTYATGTWDLTGSLRVPRREGETATLLSDSTVLVAGGLSQVSVPQSVAELYDPSTGTWRTTQSMGTARQSFTATLLPDSRVLIVGGSGKSGALDSAEIYDPASGGWTATGSMAQARSNHTATLLANGKVLVAGGDGPLASAELYDPATKKWAPADGLHDARTQHTATLLANGKVLVAGGHDASANGLDSAELYDPTTDSWVETGSLGTGRANHTATRLADGRILMAGGDSRITTTRASGELYDPAAGNFTNAGAMAQPRAGAASTLLANGKVLVTGGAQTNSQHDTAELYDPATGQWGSAGLMTRYRGFDFGGRMVFALPLASGKVLVGGDSKSSGTITELYDPTGPDSSPPGPGPGAVTGLTSTGMTGASDKTAPGVTNYGLTKNPFVVGGRTPTFGSAAKQKHRKGTTFVYTLSEAASVKIVIVQRRSGRRSRKRCLAPTRKLHKAKKCVRLSVRGTLTRSSHQGANKVAFSGRIGSKALRPGSYQATLTATDGAKNTSRPKTITFKIVES